MKQTVARFCQWVLLGSLGAMAAFAAAPGYWMELESRLLLSLIQSGAALAAGCDCIVCGEMKYHSALELSQAGLAVIELGHDASELPLTAVLAEALDRAGVPPEAIVLVDQSDNWWYPEAVRV